MMWESPNWRLFTRDVLAGYGVDAPDVDTTSPAFGVAMFRADHIAFESLDEAAVLDTWAMQLVARADRDHWNDSFAAGDSTKVMSSWISTKRVLPPV